MSIFDSLGAAQQMNPMQMLQQLRNNPAQMLQRAGYNVPANILNNPQQIVQYLVQSGQISQGRLGQAQQMAQQMMRK